MSNSSSRRSAGTSAKKREAAQKNKNPSAQAANRRRPEDAAGDTAAFPADPMLTLSRITACLKGFAEDEYFKVSELMKRMENLYGKGILSRDTLSKALSLLESETSKEYSIFDFVLEKYILRDKKYVLFDDYMDELESASQHSGQDGDVCSRPGASYYYRVLPDITRAEVKMLADAISSFTLLTMEQTNILLRDLNRLCNDPRQHLITNVSDDGYPYKLTDGQRAADIMNSIDTVTKALRRHHCVSFDYYHYTAQRTSPENYRLAFEKRSEHRLHPAFFVWSNGYYYLIGKSVGYENSNFSVFRVDRIRSMTILDNVRALEFHINPAKYRDENPVMYGGQTEEIVLRVRSERLNNAVDAFGKNFFIVPAQEQTAGPLSAGRADRWLELRFVGNPKGVALWATQHCTDCRVLKPDSLIEAVKDNLKRGLALYETTAD